MKERNPLYNHITEGGNRRDKITMGGDLLSELPWLKPLLRTKFYSSCECNSAKQCSFFCRNCMGSAFCEDCLYHPHKHVGHQSLRVSNILLLSFVDLRRMLIIIA